MVQKAYNQSVDETIRLGELGSSPSEEGNHDSSYRHVCSHGECVDSFGVSVELDERKLDAVNRDAASDVG